MTTDTLVRKLNQRQEKILEDVRQIKAKLRIFGSLRRFEELAKKGRTFARQRGIKQADVLKND